MKKIICLFLLLATSTSFAGISNCTDGQAGEIAAAEKAVLLKLIKIEREWDNFRLDNVKKNFVIPQNRVWVNSNPRYVDYHHYWSELGATFSSMRQKVESGSVNYKCHSSWQLRCDKGKTMAYVLFLGNYSFKTVHICPAFFDPSNRQTRNGILLHELSHSIAGTEDLSLSWVGNGTADLRRGSKDAYHLQEFQDMNPQMLLMRTVWTWMFPKKK